MKSPKRQMQLELDYQRHKVIRRIRRRRKRLAEAALKSAEKWLNKRMRRPKYESGKDDEILDSYLPEDAIPVGDGSTNVFTSPSNPGHLFYQEVVVPGRKKQPSYYETRLNDYQSSYDPNGLAEFMGAAFMPLNVFSPVNLGRGIVNNISGNGYGNLASDIFLPNNGLFSDEFAGEHPYWAMAGNLIGDAAMYAGGGLLGRISRLKQPTIYGDLISGANHATRPNYMSSAMRNSYRNVYFGKAPETSLPLSIRPNDGQSAVGLVIQIPQSVKDIIYRDVVPRLQRYRDPRDVDRVVSRVLSEGYYHPNEQLWSILLDAGDQMKGYYSPYFDSIVIKPGERVESILPHEIRHKIDEELKLNGVEKRALENALGRDFIESNKELGAITDYDATPEMVTTNGDFRRELLKLRMINEYRLDPDALDLPQIPNDIALLNRWIDEATSKDIINALWESNGYGEKYAEFLENNRALIPDRVKALKWAAKAVGGVAPFAIPAFGEDQSYDKGKDGDDQGWTRVESKEYNPAKATQWLYRWFLNRPDQIKRNIEHSKEIGWSPQEEVRRLAGHLTNTQWYYLGLGYPELDKRKLAPYMFAPPGTLTTNSSYENGFFRPSYEVGTPYHVININNPTIPVQIHEATHALDSFPQWEEISRHKKLRSGITTDDYLDDPNEIYSRLMEFRYLNNLNPSKKYTIDEIRKMYNNYKTSDMNIDLNILNRYDDDTLLYMINEVAQDNRMPQTELLYANRGKDKHKIYIKPKNRGKFNALKKRTGKTTELLTHSKNPLTRKRAIFAQNARKWVHKKK